MKLLDTTFLIHYWAGREEVRDYLERNEEVEFTTTTLNIKEIAVGRELQGKFDRHEILSKFEWLRIVPFRTEHAFIAGQLEAELHRDESVNRDRINSLAGDVLIAAVAKETGATVVTENTDDFESLDGVSVESY
ncbi:type II toxin-antitoxin system VapC family toxin [Halorussus sp. AFM4]|uniref:type II toxin-antitoxin system VapC family toxin n=1 Tax=Halorussus sp. AFM4 TaxID=3421651 RepID=UPI003EC01B37